MDVLKELDTALGAEPPFIPMESCSVAHEFNYEKGIMGNLTQTCFALPRYGGQGSMRTSVFFTAVFWFFNPASRLPCIEPITVRARLALVNNLAPIASRDQTPYLQYTVWPLCQFASTPGALPVSSSLNTSMV